MTSEMEAQYARGNLLQAILTGLAAAGKDPDHLQPDDLAPVEEYHTLGRPATLALAEAAAIAGGETVLDAGCGIGGPARTLARMFGAQVTGVDITREFCEVAEELTRRVGLDTQVRIMEGNALALPVADASFDVVWTQHVSMNIADKAGLYAEFRRVVRPGGRLAFFDVLAGENQPIAFPVPWADEAGRSVLATPAETQELLAGAGFQPRIWEDVSELAKSFFAMASAPSGEPPPPLGVHLLIADFATKMASMHRNLEEGRIALFRCVADAVDPPTRPEPAPLALD